MRLPLVNKQAVAWFIKTQTNLRISNIITANAHQSRPTVTQLLLCNVKPVRPKLQTLESIRDLEPTINAVSSYYRLFCAAPKRQSKRTCLLYSFNVAKDCSGRPLPLEGHFEA